MQQPLGSRVKTIRLVAGIFLACILLMGAGDDSARVEKLGHQLMCMCGCNQILLECNHVGCTYSDSMRKELVAAVDSGKSDNMVLGGFIEKYGTTVLAAPTKTGFNRVAWIMPYLALILGVGGVALLVRAWHRRMTLAKAPAPPSGADMERFREQARKETEL